MLHPNAICASLLHEQQSRTEEDLSNLDYIHDPMHSTEILCSLKPSILLDLIFPS